MVCETNEFLTHRTMVVFVFVLQDVFSCCRNSKGNSQKHGSGWLSNAKRGVYNSFWIWILPL